MTEAGLAAVVLAAGAGSRLRPLTNLRPKALCPVGNVPLVDLAIERVAGVAGDMAVNVHHHRPQLEAYLAGRVHLSIEEPIPLGTAGALAQLRPWIAGRAVVAVNADAWLAGSDLRPFVQGWDGERVRLLVVAQPARGDFHGWWFAGASIMPWKVVEGLTPEPSSLYDCCWAPRWAAGTLDLVASPGPFFDCGTPADYWAANMTASAGATVVGAGAVVEGEVVRSVVWPEAVVTRGERLVDAIRATSGVTVEVRRPG